MSKETDNVGYYKDQHETCHKITVFDIDKPKELGAKHDSGKLLFGCFSQGLAPVIKGIVAVLTYGAQKYARDSWQHVPNARERYMDALDRHLNAINMGEFSDEESGLPHIFHVVCNAMFVAWFDTKDRAATTSLYKFNPPPDKK